MKKIYLAVLGLIMLLSSIRGYSAITCGISMSNDTGCAPFPILASSSGTSTAPITLRRWTLTTCSGTFVTQSLNQAPGAINNNTFSYIVNNIPSCQCYRLTLFEQNQLGDTCSTVYNNIVVATAPTVSISISDSSGCAPFTTTVTVSGSTNCGTIVSGVVDLGGGNVQNFNSVPFTTTVTYPTASNYSITASLTNSFGCSNNATLSNIIQVIPPFNASFTSANNFVNCAPPGSQTLATFTSPNMGAGMTYTWFVDNVQQQSGSSTTFSSNFLLAPNCYDVRLLVSHVSGCSDDTVKIDNVCITPQPVLSISGANDTICTPGNIIFTCNTPGADSVRWTISGPGGTFSLLGYPNVTFNIINNGCYTLTVYGYFGPGCSDTLVIPNAVCGTTFNGNVDFVANDTFSCSVPFAVNFTTLAPNPCPGCTYNWSLTGATPNASTLANPSVTYNTPGNKNVTLTVTQNGCSRTLTRTAYVRIQLLNSTFTLSTTKGCGPLCPILTSTTTSPDTVNFYSWILPGAVPSSANTPIVNPCYNTPGSYSVSLYTQTISGCSDTTTLIDTIDVGVQPVCSFAASPDTVCYEADTISFTSTCVPPPDFCIIDYGDGNTGVVTAFPHNYIYQDIGDFIPYLVCFIDSCPGDTMYLGNTITILAPAASFQDSLSCSLGDTTYLKNLTTMATSYRWYFGCTGDSIIGSTDAKVVFPRCDTCSVCLVAYNDTTLCEHRKCEMITAPCDSVLFVPHDSAVCAGQIITFRNLSAHPSLGANNTRWDWNGPPFFPSGAGSTNTGSPINHTFATAGTYIVGMRNVDALTGCIDTLWDTITVCQATAQYTATPTSVCVPGTVTFNNTSIIGGPCTASSFVWNFGDNSTDNTNYTTTSHTYTTPGSYTSSLTITAGSCSSTFTVPITASAAISDILYDSFTCVGAPDTFRVSPVVPGVSYTWQFPGGFPPNSVSTSPIVSYLSEGLFPAVLTANTGACTAIDTAWVTVADPVAAGYISLDYFPCPNASIPVLFTDTSFNDVVNWSWDFGDGATPATGVPNVAHIYPAPGTFPITLTVTSEDGCVSTNIIDTIQVDGPSGYYTFSPLPGVCVCDSVDITIYTVGASSMTFIYGCNLGFFQDTAIIPVGTVANPRIFNLRLEYCDIDTCQPQLIFGDSTGCIVYYDNLLQYIYVDSPDVDFAILPYTACDSGQVCFADSTVYHLEPWQSYTTRWRWTFGDGDTSALPNPCHYYTQPGTYSVTLEIFSNLGCDKTMTQTLIIPVSPEVGIAADDSIVCRPDSICFTDLTVVDINTAIAFRAWDFGDGSIDTSNTAAPCHYYNTAGTFQVRLCVTDTFGCISCDSLAVQVIEPPVADAGNDTLVCYNTLFQLNGQGGAVCVWQPAPLVSNPNICNPFVQVTFDTSYVLTTNDIYGCTNNDTIFIEYARVIADFAGDSVCLGDSACVLDASVGINDSLVSWVYDFGDGTTQFGPDTCHMYNASGVYTVFLSVFDNYGCSNTHTDTIVVNRKPRARFTRDSVCRTKATTFIDFSTPGTTSIVSWHWDFGDSNSDTIANPTHVYGAAGTYDVTLTVCNDAGCCDDTVITVTVFELPIADFTTQPVCFGNATTFITNSTPGSVPINYNFWDFDVLVPNSTGDTSVNLGSANYIYPTALAHDATLIVSDGNTCSDTITKTVFVNTLPVANWSAGVACDNQPVQLTDQTVPGTSPLSGWTWDFFPCQGLPSVQNPTINCNAAGTFTVCLQVIDTGGCVDDTCASLVINTSPNAAFSTSDTTLCANDALCVTDLSVPGSTSIANWGWGYGDGNSALGQSPPCYTYSQPLANGYLVTLGIVDQNGCTDTARLPITVNDYPTANFDYSVVCEQTATPLAQTSIPGDGTLNFCQWLFWVGSPAPVTDNNCNPSFTFPVGGVYPVQLTIGDNNGCFDDTIINVLVDTFSQVQVNPGDTTICLGESINYAVTGIFDESQVSWAPPVWIDNPNSSQVQINPLGDISYIISAANGVCPPDTTLFAVNVIQPIPIDVTATPQEIILGISSNITSSIPGVIDSIIWTPDSTLDCRDCQNPIATPTQTTTYTATIYYSEDGITCTNSAQVTITVLVTCNNDIIYIPNTFTPNGDGLNDHFMIRGVGLTKVNYFRIFDRWGKLVFEVTDGVPNDPNFGWNGNDRNGQKLNPAVFVYHYELECANGDVVTGKGNVTLIR